MSNPSVDALLQIAWADGEIPSAEKAALLSALERLGLSPAESAAALVTPPAQLDLSALASRLPDKADRIALLKLMMEISFADDVLTMDEFDILERAEKALGISEDEAEELRRQLTA